MKQQQRSQRHRNEGEREHVAHRGEERDADRAFRRARRGRLRTASAIRVI